MRDVNTRITASLGKMLAAEGITNSGYGKVMLPIGWGNPELNKLTTEVSTRVVNSWCWCLHKWNLTSPVHFSQNAISLFEGMKPQMLLALGVGNAEFDWTMREVTEELSGLYKSYWPVEYFYGTKVYPYENEPLR